MINCVLFEAWANLFLFFVYETRFVFVCFRFVKLSQTAEIVNDMTLCQNMRVRPADKERLKGIQAYVKLKN